MVNEFKVTWTIDEWDLLTEHTLTVSADDFRRDQSVDQIAAEIGKQIEREVRKIVHWISPDYEDVALQIHSALRTKKAKR